MLDWDPYLELPCMRVYDKDKWFYVDVYCIRPSTKEEIAEQHRGEKE
jgi:hypothetical protein